MTKRIDKAEDMYDAIENVESILYDEQIHNIDSSEIESAIRNAELDSSEIEAAIRNEELDSEDAENFPLAYYVDDVVRKLTTLSEEKEESD